MLHLVLIKNFRNKDGFQILLFTLIQHSIKAIALKRFFHLSGLCKMFFIIYTLFDGSAFPTLYICHKFSIALNGSIKFKVYCDYVGVIMDFLRKL